jgi:hypothetical protein
MSVSIQIRLVRDSNNSLKDEVFTIAKGDHDDWRINHKSYFSQTNSTMFVKSVYLVNQYVMQLFEMVRLDSEKYSSVQLDAPCYPVVMVTRKDVLRSTECVHDFVRVVDQVLNNWPTSCHSWSP